MSPVDYLAEYLKVRDAFYEKLGIVREDPLSPKKTGRYAHMVFGYVKDVPEPYPEPLDFRQNAWFEYLADDGDIHVLKDASRKPAGDNLIVFSQSQVWSPDDDDPENYYMICAHVPRREEIDPGRWDEYEGELTSMVEGRDYLLILSAARQIRPAR